MLPKTMRAIEIREFGEPENLQLMHYPLPVPKDDEVLIRVHYAGVNRPDVAQRQGIYPPPAGASPLLGLEVAGEIVACGTLVKNWSIGDHVLALLSGGGYAEYATAHHGNLLPIPKNYSFLQAAALPETFFTVWSNVFDQGKLQKDEIFFVHGGTSGIGSTAIQMAKAFGAKVIASAGTKEKCQACLDIGADFAIHYKTEDFALKILDYTEGKGADVILDMIGGEYTNKNYKAAALGGRILQIAFLKGNMATINLNYIMRKRLMHTGSTLRARENSFKEKIAKNLLTHVWPLLKQGKIAPIIDKIYPLEEAAHAHARMESSQHIGKIMLEVIRKK